MQDRKAPPPVRADDRRAISVNVRLWPEDLDAIRRLAAANDRSANKEIARAVRSHVQRNGITTPDHQVTR